MQDLLMRLFQVDAERKIMVEKVELVIQSNSNAVIFVDGGASSTKIYLVENGETTKLKNFKRMNLIAFPDETIKNLSEIAVFLNDNFKNHTWKIGIPGILAVSEKDLKEIKTNLKLINAEFMSDIYLQIELKIDQNENDYLYIALGTGTAMVLKNSKQKKILSGWGHLFGDEGSAYDFGINWIKNAILDFENDIISNFMKLTLDFFEIESITKIKNLYLNQESFKQRISEFVIFLLENNENLQNYIEEKILIFKKISTNLIKRITKTVDLKMLNKIYLAGGLIKSEIYFNMLATNFKSLQPRLLVERL